MADQHVKETVGLLFVHGIGQQAPFEHLTRSVSEIAELLKRDGATSCAVVDRTQGWTGEPGAPTAVGEAPVTLCVETAGQTTTFECHEVYWADLGARDGIVDTLTFWLWGLGQWCAPIYRDLDAAQLDRKALDVHGAVLDRAVSQLARLPRSVAGYPREEVRARLQLVLAGLAALLTLVSWSLLKRLAGALFQAAPSPSLLVQYVGDVRTYEEAATPGDTALSDPGFPRRVGIRRRMVAQMVAMGDRAAKGDYDRWYVLGHSLGSVVAYNGLAEIGHTLPNYLSRDQWSDLHSSLKRDGGCQLRAPEQMPLMMPARPPWLVREDVINRGRLFEKLSGILTYGSPLNKFAALWPRVVATATDRRDGKSVFPQRADFRWINLRAPLDPVAGDLDRYGARDMGPSVTLEDGTVVTPAAGVRMVPQFDGFMPSPETYTTPFWQPYLQAHLDYFKNAKAFVKGYAIEHRREMAQWLLDPARTISAIAPMDGKRTSGALLVALGIVGCLLLLASVIVAAAGGLAHVVSAEGLSWVALEKVGVALRGVACIALDSVLAAGVWRWWRESGDNLKQARLLAEKARQKVANLAGANATAGQRTESEENWRSTEQQVTLHWRHRLVSGCVIAATGILALLPACNFLARAFGWSAPCLGVEIAPMWLALGAPVMFTIAIVAQALVNTTIAPIGRPH